MTNAVLYGFRQLVSSVPQTRESFTLHCVPKTFTMNTIIGN